MILVKIFWLDFFKSVSTDSGGLTVHQKNKNNLFGGFFMGGNGQNCRNFSVLDRLLKVVELIFQYFSHVKFSYFFTKI